DFDRIHPDTATRNRGDLISSRELTVKNVLDNFLVGLFTDVDILFGEFSANLGGIYAGSIVRYLDLKVRTVFDGVNLHINENFSFGRFAMGNADVRSFD